MARKDMSPELKERLAAWAKEKARRTKLEGVAPHIGAGGYSEFIEKRELEFDMSGRPDYDWEDEVAPTGITYTTTTTSDTYTQEEQEEPFDASELFETITLIPVKDYYQAKTSSSRVSSFKFEPNETATAENVAGQTLMGYIVVTFIKRAYNKPSNVVKYGPLTLAEFEAFKEEDVSFGQAVVGLESHGFTYV